ncbi:MAG TPA: hypothetical protein VF606_04305 [Geminicoccaceae bacterium]
MRTHHLSPATVAASALLLLHGVPAPLRAETAAAEGACTRAADDACERQAQADNFLALAICANIGDAGRRSACVREADRELRAAPAECEAQEEAREAVCRAVGQAPYDPPIRPSDFVGEITNPYYPLTPGTVFTYRSEDGSGTVEVTRATVTILGVRCVVVRDKAFEGGRLVEHTFDYFAQDRTGNVWYFGEATAEIVNGVPVNNNGAWIAGVDGAKPGIIMPATPRPGLTYRQEFALADAEDVGRVESLGEAVRVPAGRFADTLKTSDFTPIEPDVRENKYYARGVGLVLAVGLETGGREELVSVRRGR